MNFNKVNSFSCRQLLLIEEIASELKEKYPERASEIELIATALKHSLDRLSTLDAYCLYRYLRDLHAASSKYSEFKRAIPSVEEVKEMLR